MPKIILTCGLPGCGKSTYSSQKETEGYRVLSSDKIREQYGFANTPEDNKKTFELLHKEIRKNLEEGKNVIYDATNLSRKNRTGFLSQLQQWKIRDVEKKVVFFAVPLSVCKERNLQREVNAVVPDYVYDRFIRQVQLPDVKEGWDEIETVYYTKPFEKSVDVDSLDSFQQDNHHHSLTLGEHQKAVEAYAESHEFSKEVREAAKYHDIGKVLTKSFTDSKGNKTDEAHFFGHDNASAYLYYTEVSPNRYVAELIEWHMKPMSWERETGKKAEERDKAFLGEKAYKDVKDLHEADVKSEMLVLEANKGRIKNQSFEQIINRIRKNDSPEQASEQDTPKKPGKRSGPGTR